MSFELILQAFAAGEAVPADRERVMAVLRRHCPDAVCRLGGYSLRFADGSYLDMTARGLEFEGELMVISFKKGTVTPVVMTFMFEVAQAGDMAIFNPQAADNDAPSYFYLTREAQAQALPENEPVRRVVCTSPAHLAELLEAGRVSRR